MLVTEFYEAPKLEVQSTLEVGRDRNCSTGGRWNRDGEREREKDKGTQ
jgi:hypothetical protein